MEQAPNSSTANKVRGREAVAVALAVALFVVLPVGGFQLVFMGGLHPWTLAVASAGVGVAFGLVAYLAHGDSDEYDEVGLEGILGYPLFMDETTAIDADDNFEENFDKYVESEVDFQDEDSKLLPEPVLSSVQGTPPPLLVAGSVVQEASQRHTIDLQLHKDIRDHVARTIAILPPLPTRAPVIHGIYDTDSILPSTVLTLAPVELNPREVLEEKALKEVIAELGDQGYIDALQYCLAQSSVGSTDIVLQAKGSTKGLGARGIRNDDGTTGFTRADVLKMLRKARGTVSANLQGDIQMSGEGQS